MIDKHMVYKLEENEFEYPDHISIENVSYMNLKSLSFWLEGVVAVVGHEADLKQLRDVLMTPSKI